MYTSLSVVPAGSALYQCSGTFLPNSCTCRGGVELQVIPLLDKAEPGHGIFHRLEPPLPLGEASVYYPQ